MARWENEMKIRTEEAARSRAEEVKAMMDRPERWAIHTWENQGWHWSIQHNNVSVSEGHNGDFYALISDNPKVAGPGLSAWGTNSYSDDPQVSVDLAVAAAMNYVEELTKAVEAAAEGLSRGWE